MQENEEFIFCKKIEYKDQKYSILTMSFNTIMMIENFKEFWRNEELKLMKLLIDFSSISSEEIMEEVEQMLDDFQSLSELCEFIKLMRSPRTATDNLLFTYGQRYRTYKRVFSKNWRIQGYHVDMVLRYRNHRIPEHILYLKSNTSSLIFGSDQVNDEKFTEKTVRKILDSLENSDYVIRAKLCLEEIEKANNFQLETILEKNE